MTAYALGGLALLLILSGTNRPEVAAALAGATVVTGALLHYSYRASTRGHELPSHRRTKDLLVLVQWTLSGGVAFALGFALALAGAEGLDIGRIAGAFTVGVSAALLAVFLSSLVDWYVILPRESLLGLVP